MTSSRHQLTTDVHLVLLKGNDVLFGKRGNDRGQAGGLSEGGLGEASLDPLLPQECAERRASARV